MSYADEYKIKPLTIILRKTFVYIKCHDGGVTKWTYFLIELEELLKKYDICKVGNSMKLEFVANPFTIKNF